MFILSIVPYALFGSYGFKSNTEVGQAQQSLIELESLLSNVILGTQYDNDFTKAGIQELSGVDNSSVEDIERKMSEKRLEIFKSLGGASAADAELLISRNERINAQSVAVDVRMRDLAKLAYAMQKGVKLDYVVSGVDNSDFNSVKDAYAKTTSYKNLLSMESTFWKQASEQYNIEQEKKLALEKAKKASSFSNSYYLSTYVGIERIIGVSDLLQASMQNKTVEQAAASEDQQNVMKQDIFYAQHLFLKDLDKAVNQPWYGTIVKTAMERTEALNITLLQTKKTLENLDSKLKTAELNNDPHAYELKTQYSVQNSLKSTIEDEISFMKQVVSGIA